MLNHHFPSGSRTYIHINKETDPLFYSFDYDVRTAADNMEFQHMHTSYELWIPLCPNASHLLASKLYELQSFDVLAIPPGMLHMSRYPDGEPSRRIIIRFNLPRAAGGFTGELEHLLSIFHRDVPVFRFDHEVRSALFRLLGDIFQLADKADPLRNLIVHQKFIEFLMLLYKNQHQNEYAAEVRLIATKPKIYAVASYIHQHYAEPLSLEFLAQKFFISSYYLSHQFKTVTGYTLTDYIQATKVRNVQALLINTPTPITEIAMTCGFTSFSQFNRVFRKHVGVSPSQYRKENQEPVPAVPQPQQE